MHCREYAELVEKAIRDLGLTVDVMFPNSNVSLPLFIENLSRTGTLFAIVIAKENEVHRSVSTHVLRGAAKPEGNLCPIAKHGFFVLSTI